MAARNLLTKAAHTLFIALSLVLTLVRKVVPLHVVDPVLTLLNLQELMVFTLVGKINAVAFL